MDDKILIAVPQRSRYRALILAPLGEIVKLIPLTAEDDAEATDLAKAMVDGHAVELWDGVRFIEHFPAVESHPERTA